jgi:hypothetical protein
VVVATEEMVRQLLKTELQTEVVEEVVGVDLIRVVVAVLVSSLFVIVQL